MDLKEYELKVLEVIKKESNKGRVEFNDIVKRSKMDQSTVARAILKLSKEGLIEVWEQDEVDIEITKEGEKVINEGLPENILFSLIKEGKKHIKDINMKDKEIAIAWAKKKGYIDIDKGMVRLRQGAREDKQEEEALRKIKEGARLEEQEIERLKKRKFVEVVPRTKRYVKITPKGMNIERVEKAIEEVTPEIIIKRTWEGKRFRKYDVNEEVKLHPAGREHFVNQAIEHIRKVWLEMGFKEMQGDMLTNSFWNFDALFVPQDHPAREMQDTFYVEPENVVPLKKEHKEVINRVKRVHEGNAEGSIGWGYDWDEREASKSVLRTHTTVLSALTLTSLRKEEIPSKYFSIGKVFRNETLDWKHLFEFYQVEGIVVGKDVNFRHLLYYIKRFFNKMGYKEIRIRPAYFPYTELSLEIEVKVKNKGWMELGGAGIFREEVVGPLLGEKGKGVRVLAWGMGLERIIASYYNITDIRDVYSNDMKMLRDIRRFII